MNPCEGCGARPNASSYELFDYCAICSKSLCPACMDKGHCGNVPAVSGMRAELRRLCDCNAGFVVVPRLSVIRLLKASETAEALLREARPFMVEPANRYPNDVFSRIDFVLMHAEKP